VEALALVGQVHANSGLPCPFHDIAIRQYACLRAKTVRSVLGPPMGHGWGHTTRFPVLKKAA
jgi:hypothetical protein